MINETELALYSPREWTSTKILMVEDNSDITSLLQQRIARSCPEYVESITYVVDGNQALDSITRTLPNIIIAGLEHPGTSTVEIFRHALERNPQCTFAIVAGDLYAKYQDMQDAPKLRAFLSRPYRTQQIPELLHYLIRGIPLNSEQWSRVGGVYVG